MTFIYLAFIGFAVGLIARILLPGRDPMGIIMTTLLGVLGSYAGAFVANYFGLVLEGTWQHFALAVAASFTLLAAYRFIRNV
jgi:uncharacterized membrane protein YeaQ/YmgE (transglycosylase-associated protein family)